MDTNEFRQKIIPLSNKLLRFAGYFLKDREDAKDAVQDVLLKLWQKRNGLSGVENLQAFALQATRNLCLDKIKARRTVRMDEQAEMKTGLLAEMRDATEWEDTAGQIRNLIEKLPEQQRTVIYLRDIGQLEYPEIAVITGMELNAVRVNLSRARKQVRDELLKRWENEDRRSKDIAAKVF